MKTEKEMEEDFKDWMGWTDKPPPKDEDDPDFYSYHWGMTVWISCAKMMQNIYNGVKIPINK